MILNNVDDIKLGAVDVDKVYLGTTLVWERVPDNIPVYDLDLVGYTTGSSTAANLGSAGGTFDVRCIDGNLLDVVYKSGDDLHIKGGGNIRTTCPYNNFAEWTLELTFKNWQKADRWASRMLNNSNNYFEYFYERDEDVLSLTFTANSTTITTIADNITILDNRRVRLHDYTAAVLSTGTHTIGLCCDGINIYCVIDGVNLAYINKSDFAPYSEYMCVGTFDDYWDARTADMDIVSFRFYDTCLY